MIEVYKSEYVPTDFQDKSGGNFIEGDTRRIFPPLGYPSILSAGFRVWIKNKTGYSLKLTPSFYPEVFTREEPPTDITVELNPFDVPNDIKVLTLCYSYEETVTSTVFNHTIQTETDSGDEKSLVIIQLKRKNLYPFTVTIDGFDTYTVPRNQGIAIFLPFTIPLNTGWNDEVTEIETSLEEIELTQGERIINSNDMLPIWIYKLYSYLEKELYWSIKMGIRWSVKWLST